MDNGIFTSSTRVFSDWNIASMKLADVETLETYMTTTLDRLSLTNDTRHELLTVFLEALHERVCIIDWVVLNGDQDTDEDFEEVALSDTDRRLLDSVDKDNDNRVLDEKTLAIMIDLALMAGSSEEEPEEPHEGWDEDDTESSMKDDE